MKVSKGRSGFIGVAENDSEKEIIYRINSIYGNLHFKRSEWIKFHEWQNRYLNEEDSKGNS